MRRASILVFFLVVVVTSAMEWYEPYIRLTVNIPSDGEPIEATSFLRPTDEEEEGEQWTFVSDSIDACMNCWFGLNIVLHYLLYFFVIINYSRNYWQLYFLSLNRAF